MSSQKENILTVEKLIDMESDTIFANGIVENSKEGIYMSAQSVGRMLIWVAIRGYIEDWAIYVHWADKGLDYVIQNGDKITNIHHIKQLVHCNDAALSLYRL